MTRTRTGVAAALALTVGLATACTSTEETDSTSSATAGESASSTAETNTSRAVTSTAAIPTTGPAGIVEAIATAGGECGRVAERTERSCMLNGISFTLAESGWQAQAADRKRACDEGYISTEYQLLSDGRWTIAADYDEDYAAIKTALARLGINAELRPYC